MVDLLKACCCELKAFATPCYQQLLNPFFCLPTGAIPWLMVAELFLQEARPVAVTIATIVNWLANFIVGLAFPYILVSS